MNFKEAAQYLLHMLIDDAPVIGRDTDSAGNITFVTERNGVFHRYHVKWHEDAPLIPGPDSQVPAGRCSYRKTLSGGYELFPHFRVFANRKDYEAFLPTLTKTSTPTPDPAPDRPGQVIRANLASLRGGVSIALGDSLRRFEDTTGMFVMYLNVQLIRNVDGTLNYVVPEIDVSPTLE